MSLPSFKTQIKNIRKEAINLGFSISTINKYEAIWKKFIIWMNDDDFIYNSDDYSKFLLDRYKFDITTYTTKSNSKHQQLMRSKRILDNFEDYKTKMNNTILPNALYCNFPSLWNNINVIIKTDKNVKVKS